jgi:hypothetical protein
MVVMHLAILGGGFAVGLLGQPAALLLVLVMLKTLVDSAAHIIEHRLAQRRGGEEPSENDPRPEPPQAVSNG